MCELVNLHTLVWCGAALRVKAHTHRHTLSLHAVTVFVAKGSKPTEWPRRVRTNKSTDKQVTDHTCVRGTSVDMHTQAISRDSQPDEPIQHRLPCTHAGTQ